LGNYSKEQLEKEIVMAEESIFKATGKKPEGFRGPGFSWSHDLLEVLKQQNYLFDASTLPTYIGPFARLYYFSKSNLSKEERKGRKELFGSFKDGFRAVKPYFWRLKNNRHLLEIPVTTMPFFKIPFHMSYLLYLSGYSIILMKMYLNFALFMCRFSGTSPSFLLHPLDLISGDQIPQLAFFPGMDIKSERKIFVFRYAIEKLKGNFELVTMNVHAKSLIKQ
jgi:hypothetical protein